MEGSTNNYSEGTSSSESISRNHFQSHDRYFARSKDVVFFGRCTYFLFEHLGLITAGLRNLSRPLQWIDIMATSVSYQRLSILPMQRNFSYAIRLFKKTRAGLE